MLPYSMPLGMGFMARKQMVALPWDVKSALAESLCYILALKCMVLRRFFIKIYIPSFPENEERGEK